MKTSTIVALAIGTAVVTAIVKREAICKACMMYVFRGVAKEYSKASKRAAAARSTHQSDAM